MIDHDDEVLSRLRASDPARGRHPDLHRLRELIAKKAPASQGADRATAFDDDLLPGPRVRTPWVAAAAVVALGLGAGGYALGLQQGGNGTATQETASSPAAQGVDLGADALQAAEGGMAAEGTMLAEGGMTESSAAPEPPGTAYDPGPVRLVAGAGLPAVPGTGEVRALVSDQSAQEFIDAWVEQSGVEGERLPEGTAESMFGGADVLLDPERGVTMQVHDADGALRFSYDDIFGTEYCPSMFEGLGEQDLALAKREWAASYGDTFPFPDASSCREVTGPKPTADETKAAAVAFFAEVGLDIEDYTFEVYDDDVESLQVSLDAWPEGMPYGELNVSATVTPEGVVSAYGTIGEMTSLGDYPVISAAEAVQRYGTRLFSMDYGVSIAEDNVPYLGEDAAATTWAEPDYALPENSPLEPGESIPLLLKDKTVTGAELVRGTVWSQGAGSVEVPVWKLLTDDGMHYSVLALADEALDFQSWE